MSWPARALLSAAMDVSLIVDGANVMGSRADGWWRDRPGAMARLHGELAALAARGEGDDEIASLAGRLTGRRVVVTADRQLRRRCEAAGATVAGPGWLIRQFS